MMDSLPARPTLLWLAVTCLLFIIAGILMWGLFLPAPSEYDRTTVTVVDESGEQRTTATVRIADSFYKQYIGLSRTESLKTDDGMLFVHPEEKTRQYAMRGMDVSIDIIFIDAEGRITSIRSAEHPTSLWKQIFYDRYTGTGRWVLEMPYGWADKHGISEGDIVRDLPM